MRQGLTNQLHDINWVTLDRASHVVQLISTIHSNVITTKQVSRYIASDYCEVTEMFTNLNH